MTQIVIAGKGLDQTRRYAAWLYEQGRGDEQLSITVDTKVAVGERVTLMPYNRDLLVGQRDRPPREKYVEMSALGWLTMMNNNAYPAFNP